MGRKTLGQIAGEFGLLGTKRSSRCGRVGKMPSVLCAGSIKVEPPRINLFITLSFSSEDPISPGDVTSRLSDLL